MQPGVNTEILWHGTMFLSDLEGRRKPSQETLIYFKVETRSTEGSATISDRASWSFMSAWGLLLSVSCFFRPSVCWWKPQAMTDRLNFCAFRVTHGYAAMIMYFLFLREMSLCLYPGVCEHLTGQLHFQCCNCLLNVAIPSCGFGTAFLTNNSHDGY